MVKKVWQKSFLIVVPVLLLLPFVNIAWAGDRSTASSQDKAITSNVVNKLQSDDELSGAGIDVETRNGEVTLKGAVDSKAHITRAGEIARSIEGVKTVDNRLRWVNRPDNRYCVDGPDHNWSCS